jgi:MFS family permease
LLTGRPGRRPTPTDAYIGPERPQSRRGLVGLLADSRFGPFFVGKSLSSIGIWVHSIAITIAAFEATGSTLVVGIVGGLMFLPQLLVAPLGGRTVDRGHARAMVIAGRLLMAGGSVGLAALLWSIPPGSTMAVVGMMVSSLVVGLGLALSGPAMEAILPSLVARGELATAVSLNGVPMILGRAAGPILGATAAVHLGAAGALAMAAVLSAGHAVMMVWLRLTKRAHAVPQSSLSIRAGLRHVRRDTSLLLLLIGIAVVGFGTDAAITLAPALAATVGGGAELIGSLSSAFGTGFGVGLVAFFALRHRVPLRWLSRAGLAMMAGGTAWLAIGPAESAMLVALCLNGVGAMVAYLGLTVQIQQRSPDHLRGRIMSLWLVGFVGSRPFAALVNGALADGISLSTALAASVVVAVVAALLCGGRRS